MRKSVITTIFSACCLMAAAQQPSEQQADSAFTIIEAIQLGGGTITVVQDNSIDRLVTRSDEYQGDTQGKNNGRQTGYRIQVFSDNNVRTAKANAEYRKRAIEQRLPGVRAYLTYEAPYWRVRVGDYRTRVEADAAMREIKGAFPAFANEVRLVRDRVNVAQ